MLGHDFFPFTFQKILKIDMVWRDTIFLAYSGTGIDDHSFSLWHFHYTVVQIFVFEIVVLL